MKRLSVVAIYDSDGIIYDYLEYYISSLYKISSEMILIVNGYLQKGEEQKLNKYTSQIFIRDNQGYDAAAYKYFFENIYIDQIERYDEIILTNDTCFGPFISFEDIFREMEKKNSDFWGINFFDNNLFQFIQSNFLVFKRNTFRIVRQYFIEKIDEKAFSKHVVCMQFERGLFQYLCEKKYRYSYYVDKNKLDPYASPDILIEKYNCPLLKKRAFEINWEKYNDNLINAIRIIDKKYRYDIKYIKEYLKRKFNIIFTECEIKKETKENYYEMVDRTSDEIIKFIMSYNKIFIYGAGLYGQDIFSYFKRKIKYFGGFIVSDEYKTETIFGEEVFHFFDVDILSAGIIVGLNKKNSIEIARKVGYASNIFYLWDGCCDGK